MKYLYAVFGLKPAIFEDLVFKCSPEPIARPSIECQPLCRRALNPDTDDCWKTDLDIKEQPAEMNWLAAHWQAIYDLFMIPTFTRTNKCDIETFHSPTSY